MPPSQANRNPSAPNPCSSAARVSSAPTPYFGCLNAYPLSPIDNFAHNLPRRISEDKIRSSCLYLHELRRKAEASDLAPFLPERAAGGPTLFPPELRCDAGLSLSGTHRQEDETRQTRVKGGTVNQELPLATKQTTGGILALSKSPRTGNSHHKNTVKRPTAQWTPAAEYFVTNIHTKTNLWRVQEAQHIDRNESCKNPVATHVSPVRSSLRLACCTTDRPP